MEGSPTPVVRCGPYPAPMRLDYGLAHSQAHATALRLGGKESIEDVLGLARRQPKPGVAD